VQALKFCEQGTYMQALKKIMVANELSSIMDIPVDMQNIRVDVIVIPHLEYKHSSKEKITSNESNYHFTPRVKSLLGSFKMPENCSLDYKKEIAEALTKKYS
jgi:hypothetical protein